MKLEMYSRDTVDHYLCYSLFKWYYIFTVLVGRVLSLQPLCVTDQKGLSQLFFSPHLQLSFQRDQTRKKKCHAGPSDGRACCWSSETLSGRCGCHPKPPQKWYALSLHSHHILSLAPSDIVFCCYSDLSYKHVINTYMTFFYCSGQTIIRAISALQQVTTPALPAHTGSVRAHCTSVVMWYASQGVLVATELQWCWNAGLDCFCFNTDSYFVLPQLLEGCNPK